ncbi:MlaD family protein [Methyloversatilis universalis]|uniref:MlaD family protein n=1 Tax=Methyloversatilis universalis TaxID=378211 RepID=UPI0003805C5B|nr:MlaD family protein [Methyloversatilis universalis]
MESRAHALAAGLFLALLGVGIGLSIWFLSSGDDLDAEYLLATTADVGGLNPQAQVRYRGMRVGKVREISINPDNPREILVRIAIPPRYPVTVATRAELGYLGVTGLALVELTDDGSDPRPLPAGDAGRIPLRGSQFGSLSGKASETMDVARQLMLRLQAVLDQGNLDRIAGTLASLQSATAHLDTTLAQMPAVTGELRETLRRTQALLSPDNTERIGRILTQLESTAGEGAPLARELRELLTSMRQLSGRLDALTEQSGDRLHADTLPRLHALIDEAARDSRQLRRVLGELESSPQMLLLGRERPAPGPGEAGFTAGGGER